MKRVILTGGTGFVGANLARRLLRDGHEGHLFLRPNHDLRRIESIRTDVCIHEVDLGDEESLTVAIALAKPDWIFHLAIYGAYPYQSELQAMVQTNIVGTMNLVQACLRAGFESFVNTGSSSEYGFKGYAPPETEWLEPNSGYAVTKASVTLFCRFIAQNTNMRLITLRLYSVYGPWEEPTRLIPTLIRSGLNQELPPLVNPDIARDFVYVEDVCDAYILAARHADQELGAVYNVGTGVQTTLRELVALAKGMMVVPIQPQWGSMPNREWDTSVWVADNRLIQTKLGWRPTHTLEEGFRLTIEWFRGHGDF